MIRFHLDRSSGAPLYRRLVRRQRVLLAALSLACCAAAGVALLSAPAVSAAAGARPPVRVSAHAIAVRQLPLVRVANKILQMSKQGAAPGYAGYGDVTISIPRRLVTLYWHGPMPSAVRSRLAPLDATASVRVLAAPYTWRQLEAQTHQIATREAALRADGYTVSSIGPEANAAGLLAGVDYARSGALARLRSGTGGPAATATAEAAAAQAAIRRLVPGAAARLTVSNIPLAQATSRDNDSSPFWGGARIVRDGDVDCSDGFSVYQGATLYMLTAGHCGGINTAWQTGDYYGSGTVLGTEVARDPCCDTAIIKVNANEGLIYDQAWDSDVGEQVDATPLAAMPGASVCTEGATSGVRCNITILDYGAVRTFTNDDGTTFRAENESMGKQETAGQQANAGGDSGGPVIMNSPIAGLVYAAGTISGGDTPVSCTNIDPSVDAACYVDVWFEEIVSILNRWTVNLVHG